MVDDFSKQIYSPSNSENLAVLRRAKLYLQAILKCNNLRADRQMTSEFLIIVLQVQYEKDLDTS